MAKTQFDSVDRLQFMNYAWPTIGIASFIDSTATLSVALATIEATDKVITSVASIGATAAYVASVAITAGTGFVITLSAAAAGASVSYAVFKNNS